MSFCRFPARVKASDGSVDVNRSAVVVIDGRAEVAVQSKADAFDSGTVTVLAMLDGVSVGQPSDGATPLTGADGVVWEVSQGDGCGCRSSVSEWYRDKISGQPMGS